MDTMRIAGSAVIIGAAEAFGIEIAERLAADGYALRAMPAPQHTQALDTRQDGAFPGETEKVDVLVINVPAAAGDAGFLEISDAAFVAAMQHYLFAPVAATQAALPSLAHGARIVFISSRGYLGAWGGAHLMAASAALAAMARSLSLELADRHISVNMVAPDFIGSKWDQPRSRRAVANAVSCLASPDNGVSGETMLVDGGRSLRMTESRRR